MDVGVPETVLQESQPQITERTSAPDILGLIPPAKEQGSTSFKQPKLRQDNRSNYEKEGKRWIRRRDNSRFAANPHIVKPTIKDFGVLASAPRATFPKPLPPFLPRHLSAPSASVPSRDPASANAGRYSLSLKGVRKELRRSGPRSEQIVLDIEQQLTQWLHSGGILLSPDSHDPAPSGLPGNPLGSSKSIFEISRSPTELIWRIDEDFTRFLLHCVARFHGVVSFSKTTPEGNIRLTHLLRPNVTRPDFTAAGALDTPPASDIDAWSVIVDTEESDVASEQGQALGSEDGDFLSSVPEEEVHQGPSLPRRQIPSHVETDSSVGEEREDDESLAWSVDSLTPAPNNRDWEQTPRRRGTRGVSSPSRSPSRPLRRIPRRFTRAPLVDDSNQFGFWHYVFA